MAKAKARKRADVSDMDATPERFAHAQRLADSHAVKVAHTTVTVVDADGATGQRAIAKARRFTPRLDLLHTCGAISPAEWVAGVWWRDLAEVAYSGPRLISDYGQSVGGGTCDPSPLPLGDRAEKARRQLDGAKRVLTISQREAVEDILSDPHEPLTGRSASSRVAWWRHGLFALALYMGGRA